MCGYIKTDEANASYIICSTKYCYSVWWAPIREYSVAIASKKTLIEQQLAEAAREDDDEGAVEEEQSMEADASSDEDIAENSGRYSTQLSVEASIISMDTSASSSTMYTSLDDAEVVCLSVCLLLYCMSVRLCICYCTVCLCVCYVFVCILYSVV